MDFGLWKKNSAGGLNDGGGGYFIVDPPFTLVLIVGENVAERTGAARLGRDPCNCPEARIFASRGAGGCAHLCARLWAHASLSAHAQRGAAHASLRRVQVRCTRLLAHACRGACILLEHACLGLCSCTGRCRRLEPIVGHSCAM